jgi:hypothetical protein
MPRSVLAYGCESMNGIVNWLKYKANNNEWAMNYWNKKEEALADDANHERYSEWFEIIEGLCERYSEHNELICVNQWTV